MGTSHFVLAFVLLVIADGVMYAPYGPYFALIPRVPSRRRGPGPAMGLINPFGALGGFAGGDVVGVRGGGSRSGGAFVLMAAALFGSAVLMLFVKRSIVIAPVVWPHRLTTPVGPVLVPGRALHGGRS